MTPGRGPLRAVLFDLDGTLLDSEQVDMLAMTRLFNGDLGLGLDQEQVSGYIGISSRDVLEQVAPDRVEELLGSGPWAGHLASAALGVALVSEDPNQRFQILFDLGQAAAYMQLAAWELGVGSCPATIYEPDKARQVLGFPPDLHIRFALSFGYPQEGERLTAHPLKGGGACLMESFTGINGKHSEPLMIIFYSDHLLVPLPEGHRFPMPKYALLHHRVVSAHLPEVELLPAEPASDEQLLLVHNTEYVDNVVHGELSEKELRRIGFPWSPELVVRSRYSVGGTICTCRSALQDGYAANLAGGTHHAYPDHGEGYCVFNDVAVAARVLQLERPCRGSSRDSFHSNSAGHEDRVKIVR